MIDFSENQCVVWLLTAICLFIHNFIAKIVIILGIRKDFSGNRVNTLSIS